MSLHQIVYSNVNGYTASLKMSATSKANFSKHGFGILLVVSSATKQKKSMIQVMPAASLIKLACLLIDTHSREKKLLVEEIVQLKKQNEMTMREIAQKEEQIFDAHKELDRGSVSLSSAEQQIRILTTQVHLKHIP